MAESPEIPSPTTSYSDPIYDRLEIIAQRIYRRIGLVIAAIAVIIVVAVFSHHAMKNSPTAASANQFLTALSAKEDAEQNRNPGARAGLIDAALKSLTAVADDETVTPYYRARAQLEMVQIALDRSQLSEASTAVAKASEWANKSNNDDLKLVVGLSEAAVAMQKNDYAAAEKIYLSIDRSAGSTFPDRQMAGAIGAAKAMELQGRLEEAIAKLETLINRTDSSASMLVNLAKNEYWSLKRRHATPAPAPMPTPEVPTTNITPSPTATPDAPTPTTIPVVTPPAPVAPIATPVAPVNPEGSK
jgi:hypothetical protein